MACHRARSLWIHVQLKYITWFEQTNESHLRFSVHSLMQSMDLLRMDIHRIHCDCLRQSGADPAPAGEGVPIREKIISGENLKFAQLGGGGGGGGRCSEKHFFIFGPRNLKIASLAGAWFAPDWRRQSQWIRWTFFPRGWGAPPPPGSATVNQLYNYEMILWCCCCCWFGFVWQSVTVDYFCHTLFYELFIYIHYMYNFMS